jgi:hypothetical protein
MRGGGKVQGDGSLVVEDFGGALTGVQELGGEVRGGFEREA